MLSVEEVEHVMDVDGEIDGETEADINSEDDFVVVKMELKDILDNAEGEPEQLSECEQDSVGGKDIDRDGETVALSDPENECDKLVGDNENESVPEFRFDNDPEVEKESDGDKLEEYDDVKVAEAETKLVKLDHENE